MHSRRVHAVRWWAGELNREQQAMVAAVDALCDRHVSDSDSAQWDRDEQFPTKPMDALAEGGWSGLAVPPAYDGSGASAADLAVVHQALARRNLALAQAYYSLWVLGADAISRLGRDDQRQEWLPRIANGSALIAFALTEPSSGSDAATLRTKATRDGNSYVVNGQKVFITGAAVADTIITAVRTSNGAQPHDGITLMMIDPRAEGVSLRRLSKMGLRSLDLCEVFFDDVRVGADMVLGAHDRGWPLLREGLAKERLFLAAISLGALCDVIGRSLDYATTREVFGRPIGSHQMIGSKIVRARVAADAAGGLIRNTAATVDRDGAGAAVDAAVAKLFATEAYVDAARDGVQILGGYGYTEELPMARHYRDCKYLEIGGGTSEIQTIVIGRSMGLRL